MLENITVAQEVHITFQLKPYIESILEEGIEGLELVSDVVDCEEPGAVTFEMISPENANNSEDGEEDESISVGFRVEWISFKKGAILFISAFTVLEMTDEEAALFVADRNSIPQRFAALVADKHSDSHQAIQSGAPLLFSQEMLNDPSLFAAKRIDVAALLREFGDQLAEDIRRFLMIEDFTDPLLGDVAGYA